MPSDADIETLIRKLQEGLRELISKINSFMERVWNIVDHWYVFGWIKDKVRWLLDKIRDAAIKVGEKIQQILNSAMLPLLLHRHEDLWLKIATTADSVKDDLSSKPGDIAQYWQGIAATSYTDVIPSQVNAATGIETIANKVRACLKDVVTASIAFFVAVAGALVTACIAVAGAIAAAATVVGAPPAAVTVVAVVGGIVGFVLTAGFALITVVNTQADGINALTEAPNGFPGRVWPKVATTLFSDGTVNDGDNDWSVRDR